MVQLNMLYVMIVEYALKTAVYVHWTLCVGVRALFQGMGIHAATLACILRTTDIDHLPHSVLVYASYHMTTKYVLILDSSAYTDTLPAVNI
jgi:hypothetical protein